LVKAALPQMSLGNGSGLMLSEDRPKATSNLADGGIGFDRLQDNGQEVLLGTGRFYYSVRLRRTAAMRST